MAKKRIKMMFKDKFEAPEKALRAPTLELKAAGPTVIDNCWCCDVRSFFRIYWLVELVVNLLLVAYSTWRVARALSHPHWYS
jgi:hypothetical protein